MEARPSTARTLRDRGDVLRAMGRAAEAEDSQRRANAIATELGLKDFG